MVRVVGLTGNNLGLVAVDGRGFLSDIAVSLLVAGVVGGLAGLRRFGRWLGLALVMVWCLANFANYEHIRELGSMVGFSHAGYITDPTFFMGSALSPSHPLLLVASLAASFAMAWWALAKDTSFRVLHLDDA